MCRGVLTSLLFFRVLRVLISTIGKYLNAVGEFCNLTKQSTEKSVPPVTLSTESLGVILSAFHTL